MPTMLHRGKAAGDVGEGYGVVAHSFLFLRQMAMQVDWKYTSLFLL
jgi:hypothetical protein